MLARISSPGMLKSGITHTHSLSTGTSMASPMRAANLLQSGEVRAVIGDRPWNQRPMKRLARKAILFAMGLSVAGGWISHKLEPHRFTAAPGVLAAHVIKDTPQTEMLVEPRAAPAAHASINGSATHGTTMSQTPISQGVNSGVSTVAVNSAPSLDAAAGSASIAPDLASILSRVAQAKDPHTIPNLLLSEQRPFMALATRLESFQPHAYFDPGGLNVGYGYCISKRGGEAGAAQVRKDLTEAGFAVGDINTLLGGERAQQESVQVSPLQALRLLAIAQGEYINAARSTVGEKTFDALPSHRQAALSWLAYNTGAEGFSKFRSLIDAVRTNRPLDAVQHITPRFVDGSGTRVVNARAGTALMASYWSEPGLQMAVERLENLTASAKKGASPLLAVEPGLKLAGNAKVPSSPYLMAPGTVDIASLAARYEAAGAGLAVDASQYSNKEPVVASKGFGFDDKSMAIWRAMKAKQAAGSAPSRPKPR